MLAIAKHIDYDVFINRVCTTYFMFSNDSIWGVRRVSIELLPQFLEKLKPTETDRLCEGLNILIKSIKDDSKWVRNQAFTQIGKSIH